MGNYMKSYNLMLSCLMLSGAFALVPTLPNQVSYAENSPTEVALSWDGIFNKPNKPPVGSGEGGRRPAVNVCMVTPGNVGDSKIIWSDRPLFLWQGRFSKIGLASSVEANQTTFWNQPITRGQNSANYTGKPLQPGKTYYWWFAVGKSPTGFVEFQVMKPQERQKISNSLRKLEQQEKNPEKLALKKTKFFLEQKPQLWSDALQSAYSVENPSPELVKIREEILQDWCQPKQEIGGTSRRLR